MKPETQILLKLKALKGKVKISRIEKHIGCSPGTIIQALAGRQTLAAHWVEPIETYLENLKNEL